MIVLSLPSCKDVVRSLLADLVVVPLVVCIGIMCGMAVWRFVKGSLVLIIRFTTGLGLFVGGCVGRCVVLLEEKIRWCLGAEVSYGQRCKGEKELGDEGEGAKGRDFPGSGFGCTGRSGKLKGESET